MTNLCYVVSWRRFGVYYQVDLDNENRALALSVALAELGDRGRTDIAVTAVQYEIDAEQQARIWERIQSRISSSWADKPMVMT